jgi:hypothetical protein
MYKNINNVHWATSYVYVRSYSETVFIVFRNHTTLHPNSPRCFFDVNIMLFHIHTLVGLHHVKLLWFYMLHFSVVIAALVGLFVVGLSS